MTSEVMERRRAQLHSHGMTMKKLLPLAVFVPFTLFSTMVIARHGYFGFITLALREPWAMQMLLDLAIAVFMVGTWLRRDARSRGINAVPYLVALPFLGSVAALAYLVHRGYAATETEAAAEAGAPGIRRS